jgi:hypothetical protein
MEHPVAWSAPQPFWRPGTAAAAARGAIAQPQILRFANDEFIEEMLATLERDPRLLPNYTAQPEDWRNPMVGPKSDPSAWIEREPARLLPLIRKYKARAGLPALPQPVPLRPLKLYQPAHLRHYLVAGSLVCQAQGLPDRAIDPARQRVSFVIRRLMLKTPTAQPSDPLPPINDKSLWDEYAWVLAGKEGEWRRVGDAAIETGLTRLVTGEERLSMFPARYAEAAGHPRRLFVGSVPVGRRETYQGGQARSGESSDPTPADPRLVMFQVQVLGPWRALAASAMELGQIGQPPDNLTALRSARLVRIFARLEDDDGVVVDYDPSKPDPEALRAERSRLQTASWYLLLDLMNFLRMQLPLFWTENVLAGVRPTIAGPLQDLYDALDLAAMPPDLAGPGWTLRTTSTTDSVSLADQCAGYVGAIEINLITALQRAATETVNGLGFEDALDAVPGPLDLPASGKAAGWPGFLFLFADPWFGVLQPPVPAGFTPTLTDYLSERIVAIVNTLADRVATLLQAMPAGTAPVSEPTIAAMQPADMREAWYVMRLAYERPDCAPFEGNVVSRATVPFQMAGFFDPDAPARPIRIGLPMDISPAGLRKFDKNAVFMMSDMLCGHIDRFKGITLGDIVLSVLPWPFHKSLSVPDKGPCKEGSTPLGVMCSLSIPIVTICALILLMIIVSLLDFIFRWLPLFIICFPLPGFKAKK